MLPICRKVGILEMEKKRSVVLHMTGFYGHAIGGKLFSRRSKSGYIRRTFDMPLVSMTEMLNTAKEKGYAVGQFNLNTLSSLKLFYKQQKRKNPRLFLVFQKARDATWAASKQWLPWLKLLWKNTK